MITKYKIALNPEKGKVNFNLGFQLYGALMERLPAEYCELLHQNTIAPLSQCFVYDRSTNGYSWNLSIFDDALAETVLGAIRQSGTICLESEDILFSVGGITEEHIASTAELILNAQNAFELSSSIFVKLLTPTAFKQNDRYVTYPTVQMIVGNLVNKWNALNSDTVIDDEYAINMLIEGLTISRYKLQSANFTMKGIRIPGFVGELVLQPRLPEPLLEIAKLLFHYANFSGIGIKTALGMGGALALPENKGANRNCT